MIKVSTIGLVLILVLIANGGAKSQMYTCWGGCYNVCILSSNQTPQPDKLSCYYKCLTTCTNDGTNERSNYCKIGCSLQRCVPLSNDGARSERCIGNCINVCGDQGK